MESLSFQYQKHQLKNLVLSVFRFEIRFLILYHSTRYKLYDGILHGMHQTLMKQLQLF